MPLFYSFPKFFLSSWKMFTILLKSNKSDKTLALYCIETIIACHVEFDLQCYGFSNQIRGSCWDTGEIGTRITKSLPIADNRVSVNRERKNAWFDGTILDGCVENPRIGQAERCTLSESCEHICRKVSFVITWWTLFSTGFFFFFKFI